MTGEVCGDNRFEIISKAKKELIDSTNIETSPDEMKVLDSFLFRCWQMGWLRCFEPTAEWNCKGDDIADGDTYECSNCGHKEWFSYSDKKDNFCPHCGAKMDGDEYEYSNTSR